MNCCKCNRTGLCRNCACVKAGKRCNTCLPSRLGHCANSTHNYGASLSQAPVTNAATTTTARMTPPSGNGIPQSQPPGTSTTTSDTPPLPHPTSIPTTGPVENLPSFTQAAKPVFSWGNCGSESFAQSLEDAYCEVVHWRPNYFKIPQGKSGKSFTSELARLFKAYATGFALESVALKAATILPILALQKPSRSSKYKAHVTCLERRLPLWLDGNLSELLKEGRTIQSRLPKPPLSSKQKTPDPVARTFAKKMFKSQGKTKAALELLGNQEKGGVLQLDDQVPSGPCGPKSVREILKEKHPSGQPADPESLVLDDAHPVHDIVFDCIDAFLIRAAALKTDIWGSRALWYRCLWVEETLYLLSIFLERFMLSSC